ncbi:methyltransferase domain-containing protein [Nanoarchaeota archaeon]
MVDYIPNYELLQVHELMLSDSVRVQNFKDAIYKNVHKGYVVLDMGAGTGILSFFAVQAGASKVYAIEPTKTIALARDIARKNNLEDKIIFINSDIKSAKIPEQVDCIISEWMGIFGLQENLLPNVAYARKNFLKENGIILPNEVKLFLVPIENQELHYQYICRWNDFYGFDFSPFALQQSKEIILSDISIDAFLSIPTSIITIDVENDFSSEYNLEIEYQTQRKGLCHGFAGWFQANFYGDISLDTSPNKSLTHWQQRYLPIINPVEVDNQDTIRVNLSSKVDCYNERKVLFQTKILGGLK